jgi:ethanolamine utilization protein EutQ (cupin superfamily)
MAIFIKTPSVVEAAGNKEKLIKEYFGNVNSQTSETSIAVMKSPEGWKEPGQTPDFNEYTVVLEGSLKVKTCAGEMIVRAGEAVMTLKGEWVQYSTPAKGGAEYIAVCIPAFSPTAVNRDIESDSIH